MAIWVLVASVAAGLVGYKMTNKFGFRIVTHFVKKAIKRGVQKDNFEAKETTDDDESNLDEADSLSSMKTDSPTENSKTVAPELLELLHDPALKGFWALIVQRKATVRLLLHWLDKTEIWLGVSAGLLGMAVFAISYDFWEGIIKNPNLYPAISYSIFFAFLVNGIYRYTSRRAEIKRLNAELKSVNELHTKHVEDLQFEHNREIEHYLKNLQKGETRSETVTEQNKSLHIRNKQLNAEIQKNKRTISRLESELSKFTNKKSRMIFWKKGN